MKVTIDGVTYEGTEEEIRRIVENPPTRQKLGDCPDNERDHYYWDDDDGKYRVPPHQRNYPWPSIQPMMPVYPPVYPAPSTVPTYPPTEIPSWPSDFPRHWDGTPIVTCYYEEN